MSRAFSNNNNSFNTKNSFHNTTSFNIVSYTAPDDDSQLLAWLSPLEPRIRHRDIVSQRVDSIGGWLLESKEFRRWHTGSREDESYRTTLFCPGNPGVGKSYIISLVIDKLCDETVEEDTSTIVTCFYFDFAARNEQTPINMLGSLLRQLVSGLEGIPEAVVRSFRNQKRAIGGRGLKISEILKMFRTVAATKRTFICIDALDECMPGDRMVVLESLGQILQGAPGTRLLMTGRPHIQTEVERKLDRAPAIIPIQPMEDGVVRYLREKLRNDTAPEIMSATLEADIMKSIPEMSSETLLLASLHIEAILRETTVALRGKRLKALKDGAGLVDAYGATLGRIKAQDVEKRKLAISALMWICYSERPLQVDELCHALAVEIGTTDFDLENVLSIGTLLNCCQGLITVDKEASTVRLIHFTVQEYLCAQPDLFTRPHSTIAGTCLTYLSSRQVKGLSSDPRLDHQSVPFLKYSSRYWGTHANRGLSDHGRALAHQLLDHYEDHVSAVSLLKQVLRPSYIELIGTPQLFSGIHCASFFGIVELATALLNEKGCDLNKQDGAGRTPLSWAAEMGHEGIVKTLLEWGDIDTNFPDKHDRTPLGWAAVEGHEAVVKLLLDREGVDPKCPDMYGQTPLWFAALYGHGRMVELLLNRKDVDPNHPDESGRTPLACAAVGGHEGVVKLLLERENVNPNRPDMHHRTPLGCAAVEGHEGVVKLLLEREDVDLNHPGKDGWTPLGCAAFKGHEGVVKLLLKREDVDPNHPGKDDWTPLGCAAFNGHERVVKLLLEREDVDLNRPDINGRTPLGSAAFEGHEAVVKLLLERGDVDPNHLGKDSWAPLGCAAFRGHEGVVKLLLEREDVDLNRPDANDQTPLGCAALEGHESLVKLLLERRDIDPNHPGIDGWTPFGCATFKGHEGVVKLLLQREDVDLNRPNVNGRTPLASAAFEGHEAVVNLLLEREDVDLNRPDIDGWTPLGCAAFRGHGGVAKLLLEQPNIDLNRRNKYGRAPLFYAAREGHEEVVKLLQARSSLKIGDA